MNIKYYYSIRINTDHMSKINIEDIIGIKSNFEFATWGIQIKKEESFSFIKHFMGLIEDKIPILESYGVIKNEITIWVLYAYNGQCNMEFQAQDLLRLGINGIDLCISCWEE